MEKFFENVLHVHKNIELYNTMAKVDVESTSDMR